MRKSLTGTTGKPLRGTDEIRLEGVHRVQKRLRDGTVRAYFYHRTTGRALGSDPTDPAFMIRLRDARTQTRAEPGRVILGSFRELTSKYRSSHHYTSLSRDSEKDYRRY